MERRLAACMTHHISGLALDQEGPVRVGESPSGASEGPVLLDGVLVLDVCWCAIARLT